MNRQIKFRGKRTDTGMWTVGSLIPNGEKKAFIAPFKEQFHLDEVRTDTVGQFTGLLDKNGKEIYEGDIVKFRVLDDTIGEVWKEYTCEVSFCNGCFCTYGTPLIRGKWNGRDTVAVEICGNIHDNPESLK